MIRVLVMIAVTGFFVSLVTLSTAVALGGPDIFEHVAWGGWTPRWMHDGDYEGWGYGRYGHWDHHDGGGAQTTKDFTWNGGDSLQVEVPADVEYTQGPNAKVTVTGPEDAIADLEVSDGHIRYDHGHHRHWGDLTIVMTAPGVTRFELSGSGRLAIAGYKQDKLDLDISGNGDVRASGEARALSIDVSGSGDADLSDLKAKTAEVDINGSGSAKLAPTDEAKIDISGSGDVTLLTHPPKLETNVSGSGSLHQEDRAAATPAPTPTAVPAKKPGKKT